MIPLFRTKRDPSPTLPNILLRDDAVMLRPPRLEDYAEWARVRGANQLRLKPYEPTWAEDALSADFFRRRLARQYSDWHMDRHYAFLILDPDGVTLLGGININAVVRGAAQFASLGYWIDGAHEGQGLMRRGLSLVRDHAFDALRLHRLNAAIIPQNDRSRHVLQAVGFQEEGVAPAYLQIDGKWQDHILFGLVRPAAPSRVRP